MLKGNLSGFIVLISLSLAIDTKAQQNVSLGPTAGFGHAWMSNSGNAEYHPAGNFGVALTYSKHPHIGFGTEVKYSIEGGTTQKSTTETRNRLDYIRIPLKVMYFFGEFGDKVRPKLAVGPSFGFLVGGKREVRTNDIVERSVKATDLFNSFDAGITATAGLNYRLIRNTWLVGDVNFYNGLNNVSDKIMTESKNRNIGLNIGVNFGIGTAK
jgi:hypothetical protein